MSIEKLKEKARRHEQNEEWRQALDQYEQALAELAREEQVDIGLYNRVGDLHVRIGDPGTAVRHYDRAVELYREAYLPNSAIAVCKKIIRNVPERHEAYLRIGQIRAEQGFLPDARKNFLTYAERMQQVGRLDESFRALIEFCDLAPDDVGVRVIVAEQMAASGRSDEAVEQLLLARQHFIRKGDEGRAEDVEEKIRGIDPEADLAVVTAAAAVGGFGGEGEIPIDFGEVTFADGPTHAASVPDDLMEAAEDFVATAGGTESADEVASEFVIAAPADERDVPVPELDLGEEEATALEPPTMGFGDGETGEEETLELPTTDVADEPSEASVAMGEALEEAAEEEARIDAAAAEEEAPAPPAPDGGYVDLGAMILGGTEEKSTRFTVAYEEPTGDEAADFARMLSQFKEKVSENLDSSDVRAHYDLGTAYKEMGLLDEAISAFQAALRASADHLPTYELLGQTFMEMGQPEAAVRSLQRALEVDAGVEDELVGIYYHLARAHEALDNRDSAVEYYDRVFALDINFADVTERLRELR